MLRPLLVVANGHLQIFIIHHILGKNTVPGKIWMCACGLWSKFAFGPARCNDQFQFSLSSNQQTWDNSYGIAWYTEFMILDLPRSTALKDASIRTRTSIASVIVYSQFSIILLFVRFKHYFRHSLWFVHSIRSKWFQSDSWFHIQ